MKQFSVLSITCIVFLSLCFIAGNPLSAGAQQSAEQFTQQCNENGYVIVPDKGSGGPLTKASTYLGKSCDAYNAAFGDGAWCWANGGVLMEFSGQAMSIRSMELYCEHPALNALDCACSDNPLPSAR
ncbi:hypothetical protein [Tropicimonas sp. IMCC34043]|uniref:hypothetical protein n=1 Tax=Tropicimonas sp. IMCC34043 TaxID=2248760 RepID=UPI00130082AD|nr:hypothetical protein [Tropicimonas sp. IMCC34043]